MSVNKSPKYLLNYHAAQYYCSRLCKLGDVYKVNKYNLY